MDRFPYSPIKEKNSIILEKKLVSLIGYNIFTLKKESFNFMNSLNFIKDYSVKKIYPNHVKVFFESAEAISIIKYLNELVVLGNNGKIPIISSIYLPILFISIFATIGLIRVNEK